MNNSFYVCCAVELFVVIGILFVITVILSDYLKTSKNQLYKIVDNTRPIDVCGNGAWTTVLGIRDDTTAIKDILNKDNGNESKTKVSEDSWTTAPCPICGGPATMWCDRENGDGYFVMCGKHCRNDGCEYGIVAGGPTRKDAAFGWNKAVMTYCNKQGGGK